VLAGVVLSTIQHVSSSSLDIRVRRLVPAGDGRFLEEEPPERLPDGEVTIIDIYGSVFYADTDAIDAKLPEVLGVRRAVLVVRLRGRGELGSSAIALLRRWAEQLQEGGGALLLAGVGEKMGDQLERTGIAVLLGADNNFPAKSMVYRSTEKALEAGRRRLTPDAEA
jgi:SulP family sulfate permease